MFNVLIKKTEQKVNVDFDKLPEHVQQYIIEYGIKQRLNDCHSQIPKGDDTAVMEAVNKVIDDWNQGIVRAARGGSGQTALEKMVHKILLESMRGIKYSGGVVKTKKQAQDCLDKLAEDKFKGDVEQAKGHILNAIANSLKIKVETLQDKFTKEAEKRLAPVEIETVSIEL